MDAVVVVPEEEHDTQHTMSYFTRHNPAWNHEIRQPTDSVPRIPLGEGERDRGGERQRERDRERERQRQRQREGGVEEREREKERGESIFSLC